MQRKFGLIGKNISYSKSKYLFELLYDKNDYEYEIYDIDKIDKDFLLQLDGFNVTTPYKIEIIKYLDEINPIANEIGSVNCVKNVNNNLVGYNTDYVGFASLIENDVKKILLLGNGGVSNMIRWYCKKNNIELTVVGRSDSKNEKDIIYEELNDYSKYDCIINATKFGILPPIDYKNINKNTKIIDLSYIDGINNTIFIDEFLKNNHPKELCKDGFKMLIRQAYNSYKIWEIH